MRKRYLMTPGPTPVPPEVLLASAKPIIHHRAPYYTELLVEVTENLKYLFQTRNDVLIFASSGTGAMESAIVNLFSSGDKVVIASCGNFGERWMKLADTYGLNSVNLVYEWGDEVNPQDIDKALKENPDTKAVLTQQSETSTGVVNDIKKIAQIVSSTSAVTVIDAVSGLGATDLMTDQWGVDVVVSGSQKALMTPPGLSFASLSDRAWDMVGASTLPKFYFSYQKTRDALHKPSPQNPFTPPVSLILGLNEALKMIREEGLDNVFKRHSIMGLACREAFKALGIELFGKENTEANSVSAALVPDGIDGGQLTKIIREKYGITIAGGQGKMKGKIFRIGHCGYYDRFDIISSISALEMTLYELGFQFELGAGVKAVEKVFMEKPF